jgi:RNA polymerase sigma-70 factor (ECF subfamily)
MERVLPLVAPMDGRDATEDLAGLFKRYSRYVAAIALRLLGRDDEVDDVVQDVFLAAIRGLHRLRDPALVRGWLAQVTVRVVARRLRRRRWRALFGLDHPPEELVAPGASPEDQALLGRVYRALDAVPVAERLAWCLRHVEGMKLDEVARACRCSLATVKRRIAAAQARLDEELADG